MAAGKLVTESDAFHCDRDDGFSMSACVWCGVLACAWAQVDGLLELCVCAPCSGYLEYAWGDEQE